MGYPASVSAFTTKVSGQVVDSAHINDLQTEVVALENGLLTGLQHDLKFTDATYDIGKSGATRPRDLFISRNATIGGTLGVTGAATLSSTLGVTGVATFTAEPVFSSTTSHAGAIIFSSSSGLIRRNTADGADTGNVTLAGGGASGQTRGAEVQIHGNESTAPGEIRLVPGNVTGSKISFYNNAGASDVLKVDGATGVVTVGATPATTRNLVTVINKDVTEAEVVNTTVETGLYLYAVPGGTLGTNRALRFTVMASILNNTGSNQTVRLRITFGSATMADTGAVTFATSTRRQHQRLEMMLAANNATNSQIASSTWFTGGDDEAAFPTAAAGSPRLANTYTIAQDSTISLNIQVLATPGAASANLSVKMHFGILELVE